MTAVRMEMLRTGGSGVSWTYPSKPMFKVGEPETNEKAINEYVLAVQLTINEILSKLSSLPTVNSGNGVGSQSELLTESQFVEKWKGVTKNYFESSRILMSKKAAAANIQNYLGYKKRFAFPDSPKYTGAYKSDIASLSEYEEKLRNVQIDLDRSFNRDSVVTTSILDEKENFPNDSFEGYLIRLFDLRGKGMEFQIELDKKNITCKENHSCSYKYFNQQPSDGLYSFDPGSPAEREAEFENIEKLWAFWLKNEIDNISADRYSQIPYSEEFKSTQCKSQARATKKNLDSFQSTFNAMRNLILQQNANPDSQERDAEFRDYVTSLSQIKTGLSIWQEKLPIYYKRDAKCTEYQDLLSQTNDLVQEQKELVSLLKRGKSNKRATSNLVFDQKQYDSQAKKVDKALKIIISSIPKKTIVCVDAKSSKRVTASSPKCPSGYRKK